MSAITDIRPYVLILTCHAQIKMPWLDMDASDIWKCNERKDDQFLFFLFTKLLYGPWQHEHPAKPHT